MSWLSSWFYSTNRDLFYVHLISHPSHPNALSLHSNKLSIMPVNAYILFRSITSISSIQSSVSMSIILLSSLLRISLNQSIEEIVKDAVQFKELFMDSLLSERAASYVH
jgi:hypothetical protein